MKRFDNNFNGKLNKTQFQSAIKNIYQDIETK